MKKESRFEKNENLKSSQKPFEENLIELYKTNRFKKVMVGTLIAGTLFTVGANNSFAQSDNNVGVFIRIPITTNAKSFENGIEVGVYGQHVKIKSDNKVYGGEMEVFYAPNAKDVGMDTSGIYGDNDGFGKLGAGYDLRKGVFGKLEGQYKYLNLGAKVFLNGSPDLYVEANTAGGFKKYDENKNSTGAGVPPPIVI